MHSTTHSLLLCLCVFLLRLRLLGLLPLRGGQRRQNPDSAAGQVDALESGHQRGLAVDEAVILLHPLLL